LIIQDGYGYGCCSEIDEVRSAATGTKQRAAQSTAREAPEQY